MQRGGRRGYTKKSGAGGRNRVAGSPVTLMSKMELDDDTRLSALMRKAQAGDGLAYEALLVEVTALVRAFVRRRLREVDAVEDVVQETLLSIHRDRRTYDPERSFRPWMYAIAKHRLLDFVAKRRRRSATEVLGDERWEDALVDERVTVAEPTGASPFVQRVLALLSQKQREIIRLLKLEGWSVAEISAKTGLSPGAVKVTAHRGYQKIRKLVARPAHDE